MLNINFTTIHELSYKYTDRLKDGTNGSPIKNDITILLVLRTFQNINYRTESSELPVMD